MMMMMRQMQQAPNAFAGAAFHCYAGTVDQQDTFHAAYPQKEIYFTECASEFGSDWWSNIKVRVHTPTRHHSVDIA